MQSTREVEDRKALPSKSTHIANDVTLICPWGGGEGYGIDMARVRDDEKQGWMSLKSFGNVQQELELSAQLSQIQQVSADYGSDHSGCRRFQLQQGEANTRQTLFVLCHIDLIPSMFKNASNFRAGDIRQINAKTYNERSDPSVNVADGGQHVFARNINAEVYNHHEVLQGVDPLRELYSHVAAGAIHNSAERCDAPKCHPETRKAVQENVFSWIDDGEPGQLLWLTGPAGSGKTAIMGSVCDKLKETEQLAATFYFTAYTGGLERRSKDGFVTTLAYQLRIHGNLHDRFSEGMLTKIRRDPAIFRMGLKEQMEALILQHFRSTQRKTDSHRMGIPLVIIVDGVDECGLDQYEDPRRSRQNDQIDVLTVLLDAVLDPSFPCRVVIASRPENWIRRFFTEAAAGHFTEIFLDDKFDPDEDIKLFLKSKFAELCRRYGFAPSTWPREEDIERLVGNASGQFIYPATVIRFIDSHGQPPKKQLDIVLRTTPLEGGASPFAALDALYIAVLNSSPSPSETVLWLKAYQRLKGSNRGYPRSVWTIDRLFESSEGQAQLIFGLPSLVFTQLNSDTDSSWYGRRLQVPESSIPNASWGSIYSFYHKSFLDFLDSPGRSGVVSPDITTDRVVQWIWERFHQVLKCAGPEVPIDEALLSTFRTCFMSIFWREHEQSYEKLPILRQDILSECVPAAWYTGSAMLHDGWRDFALTIFILVHTHCRLYRPCLPGCKRWRKAILKLPGMQSQWRWQALLLDRFCIKRL
ncbi:hypothetical protein NMY22_g8196 [Coprinellus aureogranulatus]|nr:hypothetical protein NMY22_g8196 [Coprinellus aureogranulatus]